MGKVCWIGEIGIPLYSFGNSEQTGIAQKVISAVLNQQLNKSFSEFVNEYRITEVKKRLLEPQRDNLTIVGLAYECGFNSQSTFQRGSLLLKTGRY